jgi:hypothetical protein
MLALEGDSEHTVAHICSFLFQPIQLDLAEIRREQSQQAYIRIHWARNCSLVGYPKGNRPESDANQPCEVGLRKFKLHQNRPQIIAGHFVMFILTENTTIYKLENVVR